MSLPRYHLILLKDSHIVSPRIWRGVQVCPSSSRAGKGRESEKPSNEPVKLTTLMSRDPEDVVIGIFVRYLSWTMQGRHILCSTSSLRVLAICTYRGSDVHILLVINLKLFAHLLKVGQKIYYWGHFLLGMEAHSGKCLHLV